MTKGELNIEEVIDRVTEKLNSEIGQEEEAKNNKPEETTQKEGDLKLDLANEVTEFVGTAMGDSYGLVIANVDPMLHETMDLKDEHRSLGIFGGRVGAGPQIMASDEAVKASNTEVVKIELPRDTKGGAGHGSLIIFGAKEVSDARRGIEVALDDLERTMGDVYTNDTGHLEFQYTASASSALEKAFGAPQGKAFGLIVGAPASIGVVLADTAVKAATVEVIGKGSPAEGTSFTNEFILQFTGDSAAVRRALVTAREKGKKLLGALGGTPKSLSEPYI